MSNKVVELPTTPELRFNSALLALKRGRAADALTEAKALIDAGYLHAYTLAGAAWEKGGEDLQPNMKDALFYYQKAVDETGAVEAWLGLGRIYYFGKGIDPNYQKAFHCYSTVYNETRSGLAGMMLARLYSEGKVVPADRGRAIGYLQEAIAKGFALASSQLAAMEFDEGRYLSGLGHWLQGIWRAFRLPKGDTRLRPY
jgi:TPR repeat protein